MQSRWFILALILPLALLVTLLGSLSRRGNPGSSFPWVQMGLMATQHWDPDHLYEYIDGAQDRYVSYGCTGLTLWEGKKGDIKILLEVYSFNSPDEAKGLLAKEGGFYRDSSTLITTYQHWLIKGSFTPPDESLAQQFYTLLQGGENAPSP